MNNATRKVKDFVENPWASFVAYIFAVVTAAWFLFDKATDAQAPSYWLPFVLFTIALVIFTTLSFYTVHVNNTLRAFQTIPRHLHNINHLYRNSLSQICGIGATTESPTENFLIEQQYEVLTRVCAHIAEIFGLLIGRPCSVSIKLLQRDNDGYFCVTYTRNHGKDEREEAEPTKFRVRKGLNTGFDKAITVIDLASVSHFWSADLTAERNYANERPHYLRYYKSTIVVPIRYLIQEMKGEPDCTDDIGFLAVDTLSKHRLNGDSHVHMLAAFADQMYNYISIMRRSYRLSQGEAK